MTQRRTPIRSGAKLTSEAILVAIADGCDPTCRALCRKLNRSPNTVTPLLAELERQGRIPPSHSTMSKRGRALDLRSGQLAALVDWVAIARRHARDAGVDLPPLPPGTSQILGDSGMDGSP